MLWLHFNYIFIIYFNDSCLYVLQRSGAEHARKSYSIVEQLPSDSSNDASGSDDEWLPEKRELANGSSSDSEAEDTESAEDVEAVEVAEEAMGAKDVLPDKAQGNKKSKHVWKTKDNEFEGDLAPFLGEQKVNVEGSELIDFFMHLFPEDLIDEMLKTHALQHGKENLTSATPPPLKRRAVSKPPPEIRFGPGDHWP